MNIKSCYMDKYERKINVNPVECKNVLLELSCMIVLSDPNSLR